jgi:hypothetical protein
MGILSDINRKRKKATKKILNPFVKGISKISDKLIPNELRFAMPYAAGIGTLMLPPGMSPWMRALAASGMNVAGQIGADETPIEDISDINALSVALAGGLGALGSDRVADSMRSGIESGMSPQEAANIYGRGTPEALAAEGTLAGGGTGAEFLQGAENITREGVASLSDYITGTRDTLTNLGKNPGSLFEYNKGVTLNKLPGLTKAAGALGPTITHGTGDVAYEAAIDYKDEADRLKAEEEAEIAETTTADETKRATLQMTFMRQAGHDEETIKETLAQNNLEDYYVAPGSAQGGIIGLKNGGMLNLGGNEMDYRGGGFVPIGKRERADDVPARLSKNEFVMTADAVKAAGGGSVNKGAQRMYNVMNNLEARA